MSKDILEKASAEAEQYDPLGWYKDTIIAMSWDEILDLMDERIKNGSWNKFVESLGKPPHVIKHDAEMRKMSK